MIPKIIHQIWEGKTEPLPKFFSKMSESWKKYHPDWQYEFWDGDRMEKFINKYFPDIIDTYHNFHYPVQRWDVIRYLILYKIGGMYVDFDYECLRNLECYLTVKGKCYFAMEPDSHRSMFGKKIYFNNALMLTAPGHPFFEYVIQHLKTTSIIYTENKFHDVLESTGPSMLTNLYQKFKNKAIIALFPAEQVSPWSKIDVQNFINKNADEELLEKKLEKAWAIHYFFGSWFSQILIFFIYVAYQNITFL